MQTKSIVLTSEEDLKTFCDKHSIISNELLLIQVFTGIAQYDSIKEIQLLLKKYFPDASVIGASTNEAIDGGEVVKGKQTLLVFSQFQKSILHTHLLQHSSDNHFVTGSEIAKKILTKDTKVIITFSDGLNTNAH